MYGGAVVITGFVFSDWDLERRTVRRKIGGRGQARDRQSVDCAGPRWSAERYKCNRGYSLGNRRVTHRGKIVAITATARRVRPAAGESYIGD